MAETKYGKYFLRGPRPGETRPVFQDVVVYLDDDVIKGSFYFVFTYIRPEAVPPVHGPHTHDHPEILGYFGCNPDDPFDLGAELELSMGEEMENHTFTKSTLIYIPPRLVHCPIVYKRVDRPFIFVYSVPANKLQETPREDLIPENERDGMIFLRH